MSNSAALKIAKQFEKFHSLPNSNLAEAWSSIFAAPVASAAYFEGLLGLGSAFTRFEFELELSTASDRAKALYTKAAGKLQPFLAIASFGSVNVDQVKRNADSIDLMFLAADVTQGIAESVVNPITLENITNSLSELLADLDSIDIDAALRRFLKIQVGNMLQAVASFDAIGIEGLSRIYGATASEIARAWSTKEAKEPVVQGWLVKARSALKLIGAGVVWAGAVAGGADTAIEHGSSLLEFAGIIAENAPDTPPGS